MTTITIEEVRERLDEVIDRLIRGGEPVAISRDGVTVVEMNPAVVSSPHEGPAEQPPRTDEEWAAYWERWDALAVEIGKTWPKGVSAVDAIRDDRSRLDAYGGPDES